MIDLPSNWEWATLEDLLVVEERAITDGPFGSKLASKHYTTHGARVIRLQNIGDGVFRDERAYISDEYFEELRAHEVRAGDLVLASLGEVLPRACIVPDIGPAIVKADCIRARLHSSVDARWVLYALISPESRNYAASLIKGVGRPRLGLGPIKKLPIPLPPLIEQQRIVVSLEDHLSRLDVARGNLDTLLKRLEVLRKRVIVDAVPIPCPDGWNLVSVGEAGTVDLGRQRHPDWHTGPDMRSYLRVANVFEDYIDLRDVMQMNFPPDVFERFRLVEGDILLNEGQSPEYLGRPAMYRGDPKEVAFTNSILRFRARPDVYPEWALLVFRRHMHARRFMREVRITTNLAHLSAGRLKSVEFPIPPMDEQKRIVHEVTEKLSLIARMRTALQVSRKRSSHLREALLREAFEGRLVLQDADDEPASELLARIEAERAAQPKAGRGRRTKTVEAPVAGRTEWPDAGRTPVSYEQEELL